MSILQIADCTCRTRKVAIARIFFGGDRRTERLFPVPEPSATSAPPATHATLNGLAAGAAQATDPGARSI